jgi:hypothetical protein
MDLLLAAELNGYPGPSHVLELADKLALSPEQRSKIQGMFSAMKAETTPIGTKLIDQEGDLDRQFAGRTVTAECGRSEGNEGPDGRKGHQGAEGRAEDA